MSRASLFVPLGIFISILALGYVGFSLDARNQLPSALLDKPFPEFSATLLLQPGVKITKAELVGRPVLVLVEGPEVRMVSGLDHQVDISSLAKMVLD